MLNARFSLAHPTATRLSNANSHPLNPDTIFRSIIIQIKNFILQHLFSYANIQLLRARDITNVSHMYFVMVSYGVFGVSFVRSGVFKLLDSKDPQLWWSSCKGPYWEPWCLTLDYFFGKFEPRLKHYLRSPKETCEISGKFFSGGKSKVSISSPVYLNGFSE